MALMASWAPRPAATPKPVSELHPTDKVTINGMETTVQVAERLDLITRDSHSGMLTNGTEEAIRQVTREPRQ
jgi:hypothetical protein